MSEIISIKRVKKELPGGVEITSTLKEVMGKGQFEELINFKKQKVLELKSKLNQNKIRAGIEVKINRKDKARIARLKRDMVLVEQLKVKGDAEENIPFVERELKVTVSELECLENEEWEK